MKPPLAIVLIPDHSTSSPRPRPRVVRRRRSVSPELTTLESRRLCAVGVTAAASGMGTWGGVGGGAPVAVGGGWTWTSGHRPPVEVGPAPIGVPGRRIDGPWAPTIVRDGPYTTPIGLPTQPVPPATSPAPSVDGPGPVMLPINLGGTSGTGQGFAVAEPDRDRVMVQVGAGLPRPIAGFDQGLRRPGGIAVGDLDGDGRSDVVVANTGADNLMVMRGPADWATSDPDDQPRLFPVGSAPTGVALGDINGDGIPDVVVANRDSNDISVRLGERGPDGWTLGAEHRYPVGVRPVWVAIQDINNDGFADILVCNSGSNSITELDGDGTGQFNAAAQKTIPVGHRPVQFFVGYFDRRSEMEILTINAGSNDLSLVSGLNGPVPTVQTINSGGLDPTSAVAADLNQDGFTDLIVSNSGSGSLAFFQGSASGMTLTGILSSVVESSPLAIAIGGASSLGFDVYTTSPGSNAVDTVHFDLGQAESTIPGAPSEGTSPSRGGNSTTATSDDTARWLTRDDSGFNLIGVLGLPARRANGDVDNSSGGAESRTGSIRSRVTPQSLDHEEVDRSDGADGGEGQPQAPETPAHEGDTDGGEPAAWTRFVVGIDSNLAAAREVAGRVVANTPPAWEPGVLSLDARENSSSHPTGVPPVSVTVSEPAPNVKPAFYEDGPPASEERSRTTIRADLLASLSTGLLLAHLVLIRLHSGAKLGWWGRRRKKALSPEATTAPRRADSLCL